MRTLLLGSLLVFAALTATVVQAQDIDQAYTISIGSSTTEVGSQISVDLSISGISADPVGAWTIDVSYAADVASFQECRPFDNSICELGSSPNTVRATGASKKGLLEDTVLAVLTFQCIREGASPLSVRVGLFDDGGVTYDVRTEDGMLTCEDPSEPTKTPEMSLPSTGAGGGAASSSWTAVLVLSAGGGLLLIASAVLPKPMPGSTAMRARAMPAASQAATRSARAS